MPKRTRADLPGVTGLPMWEEIVRPGPKGDPGKKADRLARVHRGVVEVEHNSSRRLRREAGNLGPNPGKYSRRSPKALHAVHADAHAPHHLSGRLTACGAQAVVRLNEPRRDVLMRRLDRAMLGRDRGANQQLVGILSRDGAE